MTATLERIEFGLQEETEPGDRTFFGQPGKLGMPPLEDDLIVDGKRVEVTDIEQTGWTFQYFLNDDY